MRTSLVLLLMLSGCLWRTKQYAAPPAPPKLAPDVSLDGAPGQGLSRVVLDVAEGPALVESVDGATVQGHGVVGTSAAAFGGSLEYSRRVCVTPCVLDAKPGPQELRFTLVNDPERTSTGFVNLDQQPSIYRHAVGRHHSSRWKGLLGLPLSLGGLVIGLGSAGHITYEDVPRSDGRTNAATETQISGGAIAGTAIGVGLFALGAWLIYGSVVEDQPGSGVQWHLDESRSATR